MRRRPLRDHLAVPSRERLPLHALPKALGFGRSRPRSGAARGFTLTSGEELIEVYRPPDGMVKAFCRRCGSSLFGGSWPEGREVSVRLGSLDADPGIRPQYHSFAASKAVWETLPEDGLPRYDGAPPRHIVDSTRTEREAD
jgi:hypothetical protein